MSPEKLEKLALEIIELTNSDEYGNSSAPEYLILVLLRKYLTD